MVGRMCMGIARAAAPMNCVLAVTPGCAKATTGNVIVRVCPATAQPKRRLHIHGTIRSQRSPPLAVTCSVCNSFTSIRRRSAVDRLSISSVTFAVSPGTYASLSNTDRIHTSPLLMQHNLRTLDVVSNVYTQPTTP